MGNGMKKKSFVFNVEWQEILLGYPSEVRLEVYDAIIEYVASGTILELKPMAKMAFSFIKKEIDYNTCKYNDIVTKRSEAGKKAMNKRYNQDVTNLTNDSKTNKCYQDVTNLTVNDNDNENDYKENSLKREKESFPPPEILDKKLGECHEELSRDTGWIEIVTMNTRSSGYKDFTEDMFKAYLKRFFEKLQNEGEKVKSPKNAKSHFARWLKIELEKQWNNGNNNRSSYTSKQEANNYALGLLQQHKRDLEEGLADQMERPF